MEIKKKYRWARSENDKFEVYDVEIFTEYKDREKGKAGPDELLASVNNFESKKDKGFYPRVHIGHHDKGVSNRKGVGFLDNLRLDDNIVHADIVEIPGEDFQKIKSGKYPYRSVEYDDENHVINSLALLESKAPYFEFPLLVLEDEPEEVEAEKMVAFGKSYKDIKFMENEENKTKTTVPPIDDEQKEALTPEEEGVDLQASPDMSSPPEQVESPEPAEPPEDDNAEMEVMLEKITMLLEKLLKMEEREAAEKVPDASNAVDTTSKKDVIAQKDSARIFSELREVKTMLNQNRSQETIDTKLREACFTSGANYESERKIVSNFQTTKDKMLYISTIQNRHFSASNHPASQFIKNFSVTSLNTVLKKFEKETPRLQSIAKRAYRDYYDTINQPNKRAAQQFASTWGDTPDKYVSMAVDGEKDMEGYYETITQ